MFSDRVIKPGVAAIANKIDRDGLIMAKNSTANIVGTAGTPITTLVAPGAARAKLNQQLAPKGDRNIQMDSVTMGGLVNGMAAYFNPSKDGSDRFREGLVARTAMADYYENERVFSMANTTSWPRRPTRRRGRLWPRRPESSLSCSCPGKARP